jgi:6-phosphogluconolactonase (cycloisomerase 2 family)
MSPRDASFDFAEMGPSVRIAALICIIASCLVTACDSDLALSSTTYTVGGTVSGLSGSGLVLQDLSDDNASISLAISSNGSFAFAQRIANGTTYAITIRSQPANPAQVCTVGNGSGTLAGSDVTNVTVNCGGQSARFAYVANKLSNNISAYTVNATSGALTPIAGSPFVSTGSGPESVRVGPGGNFLYVTNSSSNNLSIFSIASGTGVLSPVATVAAGDIPYGIAVDPTGSYLYVSNNSSNNVSAYAITASSGALTEISGSPFPVGAAPTSLTTDPSGKFLYVANYGSGTVSALLIDSANGSLSAVAGSPFAAGAGPISIAVGGSGFAYVANQVAATISEYAVDSSTGALTAVAGSPLATQSAPSSLDVDPSGGSLIVADVTQANEVAAFSIADTGALSLSAATQSGTSPVGVAIDPSGQFAYVVCAGTNNVFVYTINAGTLTPAAPVSVPAGTGPQAIAIN